MARKRDHAKDARLLRKHMYDVQSKACRLSGVLNAIAYLENDDACEDGQAALIFLAEEMAQEVFTDLDSVNLPEATS
jgi:hypothetical protein